MKNSRRLCFIIEDLTFSSEVQEKDSQHTQIHVWFFIPIESSHRGKKYEISKSLTINVLFLVINSLVTLNLKLDITWVLHFERLVGFR